MGQAAHGAVQISRVVEFVDALPKTVNGKIRRAAIREADESQEGTPKTKVPEGLV